MDSSCFINGYGLVPIFFFQHWNTNNPKLVIITIEGRFVTWVVAVTCAQLQLNLRIAVHHVPENVTTSHQQQATFEDLDGRLDTMCRPGVDTLIFGDTATELEHKRGNGSTESGDEQGERCCSPAPELVTTPVHNMQRSTGKKELIITPSTDFGAEKQASSHPQLRQVKSFQGSPPHSSRHSVDIAITPDASTDETIPLSPTTTRAALNVDSRHNLAAAEPTTSSSVAMTSYKPKKQNGGTSTLLNSMSGIPSPRKSEIS